MKEDDIFPIISVITVVLNDEENIKNTIDSVYNQNYSNIEYIVIDGGSVDKTVEIVKKSLKKSDNCYSSKDQGIYDAINKGILKATGEYIFLLHSGDLFYDNEILEKKVKYIEENKLDFTFSKILFFKKNIRNITRKMAYKNFNKKYFKFGIQPPHCSFLIKKKIIHELNYYSTDYKIAGDFDFLLRLFHKENIKYKYLNLFSIFQRKYGISDTNLFNKKLVLKEISQILKKNNIFYLKIFFIIKFFYKIKESIFKNYG